MEIKGKDQVEEWNDQVALSNYTDSCPYLRTMVDKRGTTDY